MNTRQKEKSVKKEEVETREFLNILLDEDEENEQENEQVIIKMTMMLLVLSF